MVFLPFILRRARRHWQILFTLSLGVVLATALLASGPVLVETVIELGLRRTLQDADTIDRDIRLTARVQTDRAGYDALDAAIQATLLEKLDKHLDRVVRSTGSNWMFPWLNGQLLADQRVNLSFYEDIQDHLEFIAGTFPLPIAGGTGRDGELGGDLNVVQAVIGDEMAQLYTLRVGDRLPLSLNRQTAEPEVWVEVTGIVRPKNPRDPYWFGEFSPLTSQNTSRWSAQYSAIVPAESFFSAEASLFPKAGFEVIWHVLLSHDTVSTGDIAPLQKRISELTVALRSFESRVIPQTKLDDILESFQTQTETIRAPLYILTAEVVLLALYYVTMVAALSMQEAEREFAVLRSRGASGWQIVRIQLIEAGLIVAVAFLSGPLLGSALVQGLIWMGPLADVAGSDWGLSLTRSAWLAAGAGTLASLAGLLLPLGPALRRSIVIHQQMVTRSHRPPWWQRFYLDVFLLLAGLVLLWRLRLYGELVAGGAGAPRLDWLLLLSPLALLLGTATILLRVFPLILRGMAVLASRARGLSGVLAMWQASRNPTHVARLVLLLTLAIALGILSTGLNATLDQSESERAHYLVGNDVRLAAKQSIPLADIQSASGVLETAGVWRGPGTVDLTDVRSLPRFEVLAIEPYAFTAVTEYRDDYSDLYMGELLGHLVAGEEHQSSALPLSGQPAALGVWLWAQAEDRADWDSFRRYIAGDSDLDRIGVTAKLQTAQSELFTVKLEPSEGDQPAKAQTDQFGLRMDVGGHATELHFRIEAFDDGWRYFETPLPMLPESSYPLSLQALWFQNLTYRFNTPIAHSLYVAMDDVTVVDAETQERSVAEGFEDPTRLWFLNDPSLSARYTKHNPHSGKWLLALDLPFSEPFQVTNLRPAQSLKKDPVPALVSPSFLETTELGVGDSLRAWVNSIPVDFRIAGSVRYFPTMYEELEAGFLITSRDILLPMLNQSSRTSTNLNEIFVETDGSTTVDTLATAVPTLYQSWEAETVRKTLKANPLAMGLRGVTGFGYILTTLLSLVGFATHFYMSARQRETLYGVMRAMGLSPRQLYGSMVLEQVILILAGLALGTGLGIVLNQITLPRLPIALGEGPPVPPFYPHEDWLAVGRVYLILTLAFLVSLGVATSLLWRARVHRILRIGQE